MSIATRLPKFLHASGVLCVLTKGLSGKTASVRERCQNIYTLSPDGKILATVMFDRPILLWDVATGNLVKSIEGTIPVDVATGNLVKPIEIPVSSRPTVLRILEDNRTLLCEYERGSFQLWDITTGLRIKHFNPRSPWSTSQFGRVWTSTFGSKIITGSLYLRHYVNLVLRCGIDPRSEV